MTTFAPAGRPAKPVSRRGSLADTETLIPGDSTRTSTCATSSSRKGGSGNAPPPTNFRDQERTEVCDSSKSNPSAAPTAAASKPPRPYKVPPPAAGQQPLQANTQFLHTQPTDDPAGKALSDARDGIATLAAEGNRAHIDSKAVKAEPSISFAEPLNSLAMHSPTLRSAASLYATSDVVYNLFMPAKPHVNNVAGTMRNVRHQVSQSSEQ